MRQKKTLRSFFERTSWFYPIILTPSGRHSGFKGFSVIRVLSSLWDFPKFDSNCRIEVHGDMNTQYVAADLRIVGEAKSRHSLRGSWVITKASLGGLIASSRFNCQECPKESH